MRKANRATPAMRPSGAGSKAKEAASEPKLPAMERWVRYSMRIIEMHEERSDDTRGLETSM